jgi:hypothetical protein
MSIQGVSFTGLNATATLMNGNGLGNYGATLGSIFSGNAYYAKILEMYSVISGYSADPDGIGFDPQVDIPAGTVASLATFCNNREFGSGAFTTVVPGSSTSIGTGHLHNAVQAHTSRLFGSNALYCVQTIQNANGIIANSRDLAPVVAQAKNTFFGADPAENDITAYNSSNFYLGNTINNPIDMTVNGYNSLVSNTSDLVTIGQDFAAIGKAFDISSPSTFGNPGQVCQAIVDADIASLVQLDLALLNQDLATVAISDLDLPQYNEQCSAALASITNREAVRVIKELLEITNTQIVKLSDLTVFDKVLPNNSLLVAGSMEELQNSLQKLELGEFETVGEFGNFLITVRIPNMPTLGNENQPVNGNNLSTVENTFLYQNRSLRFSDILGSVAGVGISGGASAYKTAIDELYTEGTLTALYNAAQDVIDAAQDTYSSPDVKNTFVVDKLDLFTAQINSLISKENINSTITDAVEAWEGIAEQIAVEKSIEAKFDLFLNNRTNDPTFALSFINGIERFVDDANDIEFLYGLIDAAITAGDAGGEYMHAYLSEKINYNTLNASQVRFLGGVQR